MLDYLKKLGHTFYNNKVQIATNEEGTFSGKIGLVKEIANFSYLALTQQIIPNKQIITESKTKFSPGKIVFLPFTLATIPSVIAITALVLVAGRIFGKSDKFSYEKPSVDPHAVSSTRHYKLPVAIALNTLLFLPRLYTFLLNTPARILDSAINAAKDQYHSWKESRNSSTPAATSQPFSGNNTHTQVNIALAATSRRTTKAPADQPTVKAGEPAVEANKHKNPTSFLGGLVHSFFSLRRNKPDDSAPLDAYTHSRI